MRGWVLALLLAACGDDSRADQCAQLYSQRDDFRAACLQCGPIPQGTSCSELCPNAPPQQWCQLTGGADYCCQCDSSGWHNWALDCELQWRDAATDGALDASTDGPRCGDAAGICSEMCGPLGPGHQCSIECPVGVPADQWCSLIGVHEYCCNCQPGSQGNYYWADIALDCFLPDASVD